MFTNSLEGYLQHQTSRRNSYCHLFPDIDNSSKQYKCSYVLWLSEHIDFSTISCKVIHEKVFCSQTSALSWYSFMSPSLVCQSIKSCTYKKLLRCTWISKGIKKHCTSELSYSRHQKHTDRVGLRFTPLTSRSNTLIMRPQWNLTFSN